MVLGTRRMATIVIAGVLAAAGAAQAGLTVTNVSSPDPTSVLNINVNNAALTVTLTETFTSFGFANLDFNWDPAVDAGKTFAVTKTVTNNTGFAWTGFNMALQGTGGTPGFSGASTSDVFLNNVYIPNTNNWTNGTVANGATVKFTFNITLSSPPGPKYTLSQSPVPAPASLALLGLGGAIATRRLRR